MKLFYGTQAGLPLTGEDSLTFGATIVFLDQSLAFSPAAMESERLLRADLSKDENGRLRLIAEQTPNDERALVVVELPLYAPGWVQFMSIRPHREYFRILHAHTTHDEPHALACKPQGAEVARFHAILGLSEGSAVRFTQTFTRPRFMPSLRRLLAMQSRPKTCSRHWRFGLENGVVTLVERHGCS